MIFSVKSNPIQRLNGDSNRSKSEEVSNTENHIFKKPVKDLEKPAKESSDKPVRNFDNSGNDFDKPIRELEKVLEKTNKDINKTVKDLDLDQPKTQVAYKKENEDLESKSLLERVRHCFQQIFNNRVFDVWL